MGFSERIRPFVSRELKAAEVADAAGRPEVSFEHLERAHVLGQASTIVGAATKTVFWIPVGNTGGANVSPFKRMPIPGDLARVIAGAKHARRPASR